MGTTCSQELSAVLQSAAPGSRTAKLVTLLAPGHPTLSSTWYSPGAAATKMATADCCTMALEASVTFAAVQLRPVRVTEAGTRGTTVHVRAMGWPPFAAVLMHDGKTGAVKLSWAELGGMVQARDSEGAEEREEGSLQVTGKVTGKK